MKKKLFVMCAIVCAFVSCQQINLSDQTVDVRFCMDSPTAVSMDDITRSTLGEASVTNLYVLVDGTLTLSQTSTDEDFGSPTLTLEVGEHTIVFVASTSALTLTNGYFSYTGGKITDTFGKVVSLTVTGGMQTQNVELQRIITKCSVKISDAIPSKLAQIDVIQSKGSNTFSASTLCGKADGLTTSATIPSTYAGQTNVVLSALSMCASVSEAYTQGVTVAFKDSEGTAFVTETVNNVVMSANRRTIIEGEWMSTAPSHSVSVNTTWQDDHTVQK